MTNYVTKSATDAAWEVSTTWKFPREEKMLVHAEVEAAAPFIAHRVLEVAEQDIIKCHGLDIEPCSAENRTFHDGVRSALDCLAGLQAELNLEEYEGRPSNATSADGDQT